MRILFRRMQCFSSSVLFFPPLKVVFCLPSPYSPHPWRSCDVAFDCGAEYNFEKNRRHNSDAHFSFLGGLARLQLEIPNALGKEQNGAKRLLVLRDRVHRISVTVRARTVRWGLKSYPLAVGTNLRARLREVKSTVESNRDILRTPHSTRSIECAGRVEESNVLVKGFVLSRIFLDAASKASLRCSTVVTANFLRLSLHD